MGLNRRTSNGDGQGDEVSHATCLTGGDDMSRQPSDQKPTSAPNPEPNPNPNQPTLTELSPEELAKVSGGQKVQTSEFHIMKVIDKTSP
jgi:hypothetical protein